MAKKVHFVYRKKAEKVYDFTKEYKQLYDIDCLSEKQRPKGLNSEK